MGARAAVTVLAVLAVSGWGTAAGLGAAVLVLRADAAPAASGAGSVLGAPAGDRSDLDEDTGPGVDSYVLTVHPDGCGVVRTEGPGGSDLHGLTWSVVDAEGFEVLGRNALGETRYRFFSGGTFDVVLEAWGGEAYVPVSNTVTITC